MLTIALPKGRILQQILPLLEKCNFLDPKELLKDRRLVHPSLDPKWQVIIVRAYDVPAFVECGSADIGITGKDVLMEFEGNNHCELLDLKLAPCKLMTATMQESDIKTQGLIKVASKFPKTATKFFASKGQQAEMIKLHGAMELAPILGMADCIVDIVDTGNTLKHNGLKAVDLIANISSRLIANKASLKTQFTPINTLVKKLQEII